MALKLVRSLGSLMTPKRLMSVFLETVLRLKGYIALCQGSGVSSKNHLPSKQTRQTNPLARKVDLTKCCTLQDVTGGEWRRGRVEVFDTPHSSPKEMQLPKGFWKRVYDSGNRSTCIYIVNMISFPLSISVSFLYLFHLRTTPPPYWFTFVVFKCRHMKCFDDN